MSISFRDVLHESCVILHSASSGYMLVPRLLSVPQDTLYACFACCQVWAPLLHATSLCVVLLVLPLCPLCCLLHPLSTWLPRLEGEVFADATFVFQ